ncbi:MAG: beta strand repeat-containing protein [Roseibacillus sp.]
MSQDHLLRFKAVKVILFIALTNLTGGVAHAQVPATLHHQGRIVSNNVNFDGTGQFKFCLYHGTSPGVITTPIWKNDDSSPANGSEPATAISIAVTKGLYSLALGASPQQAITAPLTPAANSDLYLRIWFNDGSNGFQLLSPDRKISSVPFARHAGGGILSDFINDVGFLGSDDFAFAVESDVVDFSQTQLGGTTGAFSTSFTFAETFPEAPTVTLDALTGITNPAVSNVTTTGFDLDFDFDIVNLTRPVPTTEQWPYFDLLLLDGKPSAFHLTAPYTTFPGNSEINLSEPPSLLLTRAEDSAGSLWKAPVELGYNAAQSGESFVGYSQPLNSFDAAVVAGTPSFVALTPTPLLENGLGWWNGSLSLEFRKAIGTSGENWQPPIPIDTYYDGSSAGTASIGALTGFLAGVNLSLTEVDGTAAVLASSPVFAIYYRASNANGVNWSEQELSAVLSASGSRVATSNLLSLSGKPAIAYAEAFAPSNNTTPFLFVRLVVANNANGTSWNSPITIWSATVNDLSAGGATAQDVTQASIRAGLIPSLNLSLLGGKPAVTFSSQASSAHGLFVSTSTNTSGTAWSAATLVDSNDSATFPQPGSLISRLDATSQASRLHVIYKKGNAAFRSSATNAAATAWTPPTLISADARGVVKIAKTADSIFYGFSQFASTPAPIVAAGLGTLPSLPTQGSLWMDIPQEPSLNWNADDPAEVPIQQQVLSLNGSDLTISAGNTIDLAPLVVNDHGALTGLLDDDHPQYFLGNGSEPLGGNLDLDNHNITGISTLDTGGISVSGSISLPSASVSNNALQPNVMLENEFVSLLTNDANYLIRDTDASITNATITGNAAINGNNLIEGISTFNGDSTFNEDATINGITSLNDDTSIMGDLLISGNTTTGGLNTFNGNAIFNGLTTLNDDVTLNGNMLHTGNSTIDGTSTFEGDATFNEDVTVDGITTLNDDTTINGDLIVNATDGLLAGGARGTGTILTSGVGTRMLWHPYKAAFRAGEVLSSIDATAWDETNIGQWSTAFGLSTIASSNASFSVGSNNISSALASVTLGEGNEAESRAETIIGRNATLQPRVGSATTWSTSDRLFAIGNGTSTSSRSDAFSIQKTGDATLNGELCVNDDVVVSGNYKYKTPKNLKLQIAGSAFAPLLGTDSRPETGKMRFTSTSSAHGYTVQANLPPGATVTNVTLRYYAAPDGSTGKVTSLNATLRKRDLLATSATGSTLMASFDESDDGSLSMTYGDDSIANATVTSNEAVFFEVTTDVNSTIDIGILGLTIDYTLDTLN